MPVGHTKYISAISMSPNGKLVLTSSYEEGTKLWDNKGREVVSVPATSYVNAFSPDGQCFLTADTGNTMVMWDLSGKLKFRFSGHTDEVRFVAWMPDGKWVVSADYGGDLILWDLTGTKIRELKGVRNPTITADGQFIVSAEGYQVSIWNISGTLVHQFEDAELKKAYESSFKDSGIVIPTDSYFTSVAVSPDQKSIATCTYDGKGGIWSWQGEKLHTFRDGSEVRFSPDGKYLLTAPGRGTFAQLLDQSGQTLQQFWFNGLIGNAIFTPDGKNILISSTKKAYQLDLNDKVVCAFKGHATPIRSLALSPDNTFLAAGCCDEFSTRIWQFNDGQTRAFSFGQALLSGDCSFEDIPVAIAPNSKSVLTVRDNNVAQLWNLKGAAIQTFIDPEESIVSLAFSSNGKNILTGNRLYSARLWDAEGREVQTFPMPLKNSSVDAVAFSADNTLVATGSGNIDNYVRIWEADGTLVSSFLPEVSQISDVVFSPDNKTVLVCGYNNTAQLFDLKGNKRIDFSGHEASLNSVAFSPNGQKVLTASDDGTARLWDLNGQEILRFTGHKSEVMDAVFFKNGNIVLTGSLDHTMKLWDANSGKNLATLIFIDSNDWVVTTPSGLFDATDGAKAMMYYIVDYQEEKIVVSLDQLEERYWQPGLLGAVLGITQYPVRDVGIFNNLPLFPSIEKSTHIESDQLIIKLRERNGGLGKLSLKINGRRVAEDLNPLPQRKKELNLDLKQYARYLRTDTLNILELEAYESKDYLKSEPYILDYQASVKGRGEGAAADNSLTNNCLSPRHLYLIIVGTSSYPYGVDSLPSADEDAVEMARVLRVSGQQLYDDRVHLKLLSTKAGETPSKANIKAAFRAYQDSASVCDVLVVFFAGHGSNWGKDGDKSNFYYLTKDITFGRLNDDGIRQAYAISDQELTEWMTKIPAQNQLLILDACNSGQAAINMGGIVSRDLNPDKVVAFNLMSGNTGSYVISGSSESGASFESAVFGHGLLTYSLLEGINGTALEGSKIDVLPLLLKSYKRVGELAESLGQVQTPIIAKPRGNASFFVGRNDGSIQIELPETKPMVIRSFFFDQNSFLDHLDLTNELNTAFRSKEVRGKLAPWFYSDISEHPQGFSVRGTYLVNADNSVTVRGSLIRGEVAVGEPFVVSGAMDAKVLTDLILRAVRPGIKVK